MCAYLGGERSREQRAQGLLGGGGTGWGEEAIVPLHK